MERSSIEGANSIREHAFIMKSKIDWSQKDTPETRGQIVEEFLPMAEMLAQKRLKKLDAHIDRHAIISAAHCGLLNAIKTYVPGKSSFRTYARMRVDHTITDCLRDLDHLSRLHRKRIRKHVDQEVAISQTISHAPSDEEFLEATGETRIRAKAVRPLEALETMDHPIQRLRTDLDRSESARAALKSLNMDEQTIIYLHFFHSARMKDIGIVLGISESRVSQICKAVLEKLKNRREQVIEALVDR